VGMDFLAVSLSTCSEDSALPAGVVDTVSSATLLPSSVTSVFAGTSVVDLAGLPVSFLDLSFCQSTMMRDQKFN